MGILGSIAVSLAKRLVPSLVCAYFTRERGEAHREGDRLRWWGFSERAKQTKTKADDCIAVYLKARCNFHDSPETKANATLTERARLHGNHP